jgi:hypothetical protein
MLFIAGAYKYRRQLSGSDRRAPPSVARSAAAMNPEFGVKTGRNPPRSAARGAVRRGGPGIALPIFDFGQAVHPVNLLRVGSICWSV